MLTWNKKVYFEPLKNYSAKSERRAIPEYNEQKEIAKYLQEKVSVINNLIDEKETFISEMENYKKSLIYEYVTGKKEVPEKVENYTDWRQQHYDKMNDAEVEKDITMFTKSHPKAFEQGV